MKSFYLDNNALAYILDRCSQEQRDQLLQRCQANRVALFSSISSLEELTPFYNSNAEQYRRQIGVLQKFIGLRIFRRCDELMRLEIKMRRQLPSKVRLLSRGEIESVYAMMRNPAMVADMAAAFGSENIRQLKDYRRLQKQLCSDLSPSFKGLTNTRGKDEARMRGNVLDTVVIDSEFIEEWYPTIVSAVFPDIELGSLPKVSRLPCAHARISIFLAAIRKRHGTAMAPGAGDVLDEMHYAQAAYCDYFVSSDSGYKGRTSNPLKGLLNHMSCRKLNVIDFKEFLNLALL